MIYFAVIIGIVYWRLYKIQLRRTKELQHKVKGLEDINDLMKTILEQMHENKEAKTYIKSKHGVIDYNLN